MQKFLRISNHCYPKIMKEMNALAIDASTILPVMSIYGAYYLIDNEEHRNLLGGSGIAFVIGYFEKTEPPYQDFRPTTTSSNVQVQLTGRTVINITGNSETLTASEANLIADKLSESIQEKLPYVWFIPMKLTNEHNKRLLYKLLPFNNKGGRGKPVQLVHSGIGGNSLGLGEFFIRDTGNGLSVIFYSSYQLLKGSFDDLQVLDLSL